MLKTPVSFEVASRHKNYSFVKDSTYHISTSFTRKLGDFQTYFRVAELLNCHKQRCLQNHHSGDLLHSLAYIQSLAFPRILSHFFSLSSKYRKNLSLAQNESFFTHYSFADLFKAGFFWSGSLVMNLLCEQATENSSNSL